MTDRKKGDRGQARSALVAVRFDPALKARMDAVASSFLRSTANYVEWAVLRALEVDEQTVLLRERELLATLLERHGYSVDHDTKTVAFNQAGA